MTATATDIVPRERDRAGRLRWGLCFALISSVHVGAIWIATHWRPAVDADAPPPAALMIDLAPLPSAPPAPASEIPPGPQQVVSEPPLPEPPPLPPPSPPVPAAEAAVPLPPKPVPLPPPPKPQVVPRPVKPQPDPAPSALETSAPPSVPAPEAPAVAAPAPGATAAPSSNAVPTWQGLLLGRLEQFKRYPAVARLRRQQGLAYLRFKMDRLGKVLSAVIDKSSGFDALDAETLALIHRAEPLPPPPPEVQGDPIELVVPVEFFLR